MSKRKRANWWAQTNGRQTHLNRNASFESPDHGIFATCERGRERRCIDELYDLLEEYTSKTAIKSTDDSETPPNTIGDVEPEDIDLEVSIARELEDIKAEKASHARSLQHVDIDTQCITFIRLPQQLDPVQIVHSICTEAKANPSQKRTRFIQRMTPMTLMKKGLPSSVEILCKEVVNPHFHSGGLPKKFAIRPTIRENKSLDRDQIIHLVADIIMSGRKHTVDLKNYDLLVLVDVYRNICGMSVVGADYRELKGYNLAELYQPLPPPSAEKGKISRGDAQGDRPAQDR